MRKIALALAILGTTLGTALYTAPAHAQATRTFVSGVGDDANPCSRTAPCKTWAGAIAKTAPGGEMDALDPGGFGAVTITKSITIDGGGGQVASVLVAGTNGIVIAAGASDLVIIRNMRLDGLLGNSSAPGNAGINGIRVISGAQVSIDNCDIFGFNTNGIDVELSTTGLVQIRNTTLRNNTTNGVFVSASSGNAVVQLYNSSVVGNFLGGTFPQGGVTAGSGAIVTVSNTNFQDVNYGAQVLSGGALNVEHSLFAGVNTGILTASGTTAFATDNTFYNNTALGGSGTINTPGDNKLGGTATVGGSVTVNSSGMTKK